MTEFVLLHGLGGSPAAWRRVLPTLQHHGRVHAPSLACRSTVADQALQVHHWLAGRTETTSFVVVGHSLGGLVATSLAEQFPMLIERLVLINPPPSLKARRTANQLRERGLRTPVVGALMWSLATRASLRRGLSSAVAPGFTVPDFSSTTYGPPACTGSDPRTRPSPPTSTLTHCRTGCESWTTESAESWSTAPQISASILIRWRSWSL
ncbi:alpha/beta fold hydrolase [Nocardia sp. NPDC003979]